jgi:hypothetical protein
MASSNSMDHTDAIGRMISSFVELILCILAHPLTVNLAFQVLVISVSHIGFTLSERDWQRI